MTVRRSAGHVHPGGTTDELVNRSQCVSYMLQYEPFYPCVTAFSKLYRNHAVLTGLWTVGRVLGTCQAWPTSVQPSHCENTHVRQSLTASRVS